MSQKQPDISLSTSEAVVEKYVSSKHFVLCTSPNGANIRWIHNSAEHITETKGRYVTSLSVCPLCFLRKVTRWGEYRNDTYSFIEDGGSFE
jgi:hypothetical protein